MTCFYADGRLLLKIQKQQSRCTQYLYYTGPKFCAKYSHLHIVYTLLYKYFEKHTMILYIFPAPPPRRSPLETYLSQTFLGLKFKHDAELLRNCLFTLLLIQSAVLSTEQTDSHSSRYGSPLSKSHPQLSGENDLWMLPRTASRTTPNRGRRPIESAFAIFIVVSPSVSLSGPHIVH